MRSLSLAEPETIPGAPFQNNHLQSHQRPLSLAVVKLVDDFFGNRPLQHRGGEHRRGGRGSVVAQLVKKTLKMLNRDDARLDDKGVRTRDAVALDDLVPGFYLLLKGAHQRFRAGHRQAHKDQDGKAQPLQTDVGMEAADDAELLQSVYAL